MSRYSADISVMIKACEQAGRGLVRDSESLSSLSVHSTGARDFCTDADLRSEKTLCDILRTARPKYGFLLEEGGIIEGEDPSHVWVIDPLDGTFNFMHGHSYFCISLALCRTLPSGGMEPIAGVIYAPLLQELFWAEKGSGAWFEELGDSGGLRKRLRISTRSDFSESFLCLGSLRELTRSGLDKAIAPLLEKFHGVRSYGSSALSLAYVAAGNFDIFVQQILSPWDIAAALLLIREAGGYATDFAGRNHTLAEKSIVAGNEKLQLAIVQELKKNHIS